VREAQPGQILHLSQAQGEFTLTESPATPTNNRLLMISGGSGITPVMAQIRTLLRDGYDGKANRKVTFLHYARSAEEQIFAEELNRIAWQDNGIDVHLRHGDEFFTAEALARLVPDFRGTDTWACGPAPMMALVSEAYDGSPRLRTEYFKTPMVSTGSAEGDVSFTRAGSTATNTGAVLLEQAEAQGLTPEYGCRMGICFTCVSRKTEGTVRNVLTGEESSLPDEDIRICVSAPVGDCALDL
jgi:ferredoxin-NADP reductase